MSIDGYMNKVVSTHTVEYYSAFNKKKKFRDFPGGPGAKTLHSSRFDPWPEKC